MRASRREHDHSDGPDRLPDAGSGPDRLDADDDVVGKLGDLAATAGLRRIAILAWRDLDDPEAGGSELHASRVASLWAEAGIEVTMRTSYAAGHPQVSWRGGYRVIRKAGRYLVFPRAAFSEMMGWHGASDGLIEIWNGMPFFSPLWARRPTVAWLHHVHDSMWEMTLSPRPRASAATSSSTSRRSSTAVHRSSRSRTPPRRRSCASCTCRASGSRSCRRVSIRCSRRAAPVRRLRSCWPSAVRCR